MLRELLVNLSVVLYRNVTMSPWVSGASANELVNQRLPQRKFVVVSQRGTYEYLCERPVHELARILAIQAVADRDRDLQEFFGVPQGGCGRPAEDENKVCREAVASTMAFLCGGQASEELKQRALRALYHTGGGGYVAPPLLKPAGQAKNVRSPDLCLVSWLLPFFT